MWSLLILTILATSALAYYGPSYECHDRCGGDMQCHMRCFPEKRLRQESKHHSSPLRLGKAAKGGVQEALELLRPSKLQAKKRAAPSFSYPGRILAAYYRR
ncbi:hypothetical protein PMAYCL1PPCAC_10198 [Pristionchus mayeri]|uniref:Uncharacterized protein n=1 Tax=Pristionchus mayeri TaxID=1317129 RepID=A0AAN4ZKE5_9BILA|nr:hypothetical protein PMAYCL1PPCAC_10198 [Pristionchus mayeri]